MNTKEYIESGILESYALGLCNESESREVEELCTKYPEFKTELDKIQLAINSYASMYAKSPKEELKEKVFAKLDLLNRNEHVTIPLAMRRYQFAIAASVILFALSVIGNIILYNKYRATNEQLISLNVEKTLLSANMKVSQVKLDKMNSDMAILTDPRIVKVMMKGVEKSPESMVLAYWNKESKELFIQIKKLPMPVQGKQYQLWAIVDGKPQDAGMITMTEGDSTLHKMKDFSSSQAFAITLEKEGGSPVPTLSDLYVMGQVSL